MRVCVCVCALPSMTTVGYWVLYTKYAHAQIYIYVYRLSADQMGGTTTSTVDVTTNSTVMLSFLHWVIPQYIVLAPTSTSICLRRLLQITPKSSYIRKSSYKQ